MGGFGIFLRGFADPRAGLNELFGLFFSTPEERAILAEEAFHRKITGRVSPSFLSRIFNWVIFGPLLYLLGFPFYIIHSVVSLTISCIIWFDRTVASLKRAFLQTCSFIYGLAYVFFLSGFALQTIRVVLMIMGVPIQALSIKFLEDLLNIFFSLCTALVGAPRWVRQRPGRNNPIWLIVAAISIFWLTHDIKSWSPAWRLTVLHFIFFVASAGPLNWRGPGMAFARPDHEVVQMQALLTASILGVSLATTETVYWSPFYRIVAIVSTVVIAVSVLNLHSDVTAHVIFVNDPQDARIGRSNPGTWANILIMLNTTISVFVSRELAEWPFYYKWPLIAAVVYFNFLIRGMFRIIAGDDEYFPVRYVARPPREPEVKDEGDDDDDDDDDDYGGFDQQPRLPRILRNAFPFLTNRQMALFYFFRYRVEPAIYHRYNLTRRQAALATDVLFETISDDLIMQCLRFDQPLDEQIRRVIYELTVYDPRFTSREFRQRP